MYYSAEVWGSQYESQRPALPFMDLAFHPACDEVAAVDDSQTPAHLSVFGGDVGDEAGELCGPMLQVLLDLNLFA